MNNASAANPADERITTKQWDLKEEGRKENW
jgi:hypothetical protein